MEVKKDLVDNKLRLIVFKSAWDLGQQVDKWLLNRYGIDEDQKTFIVPIKENFFDDGHLKVEIEDTIRGKDVFLLTDIGNYSIEYTMHGFTNHTSPNDLMMELKDGLGACSNHPVSLNIVMPLLYAGRQHRKNTRENLMCSKNLQEIDTNRKMRSFITFDVHDQSVEQAIFNMEFENVYATSVILEQFINDLNISELDRMAFIAPDTGATGRRNVYLNSFNYNGIDKIAGSFVKMRDYNNFSDGKYPVVEHKYSGDDDLSGRTAIVIDDMISSGGSMFDVIEELHKRNVGQIYLIVTYALFTKGVDKFDEYYEKGMLSGVYTTNLSYIPLEYKEREWLNICDCSNLVASVIYDIHNDNSISNTLKDKSGSIKLLEKKFQESKKMNS